MRMMEAVRPSPAPKKRASRNIPPLLKVDQVEVAFGKDSNKPIAINGFEIKSGEKVLIYGPSGYGKTTLLHLLAGLLVPDSGSVFIDDIDICALPESRRSRLRKNDFGVIFQTLNLLDHLTALENVCLASGHGRWANEQAHAALESVSMGEHANVLAASLSLGQRQRIAVARVLATSPRIILADEPTSSLDEANARGIMEALLEAGRNATFVMVSHDVRIRQYFNKTYDIGEIVKS